MNKFLTKIVGVVASLALVVGVGVGISANKKAIGLNAAAEVAATLTFTSDDSTKVQGYTSSFDQADSNSDDWTLSLFNNNNWGWSSSVDGASKQVKCGNKTTATVATIQNKAPFTDVTYTKVDLYISAYSSSKFNSIKVYGSNVSSFATKTELASKAETISTSTTVPTSLTLSNTSNYNYYRLAFDTKNGGSSNGFITLDKVVFWHENSSTPIVNTSSATLFMRTGGSGQTVTATASNFSGAVSYSWAYQSGTDCVDLTNENTATVTMTPKSSIVSLSTGVYRVTATYSAQSATADVTVTIDNGGSSKPYTIAEARSAIDAERGLENAYVRGIVYKVDSYNSTYHSITYWISDDGTNSVPFQVFGGLAIEGQPDFTSKDDISLGDIVVVKGTIKNYKSTYEVDQNNRLISKISIASIAVKTAPTKVNYNSSEFFDPTGLVVTATYDDTPTPTTKDYAYSVLGTAFSFDPTTTTALTSQTSVSITLFGKSTSQSITVLSREITGVTLMGDMSDKTYYDGDAWDLTGLYLSIAWNTGDPNPSTIDLVDVDPSNYELGSDTATKGTTSLYIYGIYEGFEFEKTVTGLSVDKRPIKDVLRTASTSFNLTETSYTEFSNKTNSLADINSGVTWAGTAACNTSKSNALQLNGTSRGIYTTASSGQLAKSVAVSFKDDNGKSLYFYGSNTAYSGITAVASDENSTLIATLDKDTLSATISGDYKYIYIYSSGATYMNSITVTWTFANETIERSSTTLSSIRFDYASNGEGYDYSDVALRFGGFISQSLWADLNSESTITGYGVIVAKSLSLGGVSIEERYAAKKTELATNDIDAVINGICDGANIQKVSVNKTTPAAATSDQKAYFGIDSGDYYIWTVRKTVASFSENYTAVAFIKTANGIVFLNKVVTSAKAVARRDSENMNPENAHYDAVYKYSLLA